MCYCYSKMAKLTDQDDIEAFLMTFEKLMEAYQVPKARCAYKLAISVVRLGSAGMRREVSRDHNKVK